MSSSPLPDGSPQDQPPRPNTRHGEEKKVATPYLMILIWAIGGGTIAFVQRPQFFDHQIGNILTLVAGFLMLVSLLGWFCLQRVVPLGIRLAIPALLACSVLIFFVIYRIEEVSGELVPKFSYRFAPPDDAQIKAPEKTDTGVDLTVASAHDFPGFLGPDRNARYDAVELTDNWQEAVPQQLWLQPIGAGWGGFAAVNGFAVTLEQRGADEMINCYEIETGKLAWSQSHPWRHETLMGGVGPRSTPTIHEGRVYAQGAGGMLFCLAGESGEILWQRNLLQDFGVTKDEDAANVSWGRAGSPLVVDDKVILPAGGPKASPVSLVAYHKVSGEEMWRGGNSQISYSSPALATIGGMQQVLIVNESSVAGHDLATGEELWNHPWPGASNANATASQAVPLPNDRVLVSKGYAGGSAVLQIANDNGQWSVSEVWQDNSLLKTKFTNVVVDGAYAYGLSDGILECVDLDDGQRQWKKGRYGHGQILLAGSKLLVLDEAGTLHMVEKSAEKLTEVGEIDVLTGKTWNTLCLYGPYLLIRNGDEAACLRLPLENEPSTPDQPTEDAEADSGSES